MKKNPPHLTKERVDKSSHKVGKAVRPARGAVRRSDTEVVYKRKANYTEPDYVRSE
ncbi:hypothetical protein QGM71_07705 [Virgibacillus sp. C22-A2]|uniref:Uncharacterized protein n=1 Tax=Virgibacillus tibetensis TaxID=3042313 RepID=A0ABU6KDY3_9BACI|nr:hypothetical protein [Virgibacillus sp. C22-A2]